MVEQELLDFLLLLDQLGFLHQLGQQLEHHQDIPLVELALLVLLEHQDVFITNKNFLIDLLNIFRANDRIGLVGLVGTPYMSKNGTMWNGMRYGAFYNLKERFEKGMVKRLFPLTTGYMEMEAVDGLLMATQYDIPWREDIFQKWDYYDVSQCFEFLKAGYKVVVPGQETEWYIHDCGIPNFDSCRRESYAFLENYPEYMAERKEQTWEEYLEQVKIRVTEGFHGTEEVRQELLQFLDEVAGK